MDDLISLKEAINAMKKLYTDDVDMYGVEIPECFDDKRSINALETLPAVDAVPVVRCKDCKNYIGGRCYEWRSLADWRGKDEYCSRGERREE